MPKVGDPASMDRAQAELTGMMDELTPLVQELEGLRGEFLEKRGFEEYKAERAKLKGRLLPVFDRFASIRNEYSNVRKTMTAIAVMSAMGDLHGKTPEASALASSFATSNARLSFGDDAHQFEYWVLRVIKSDDESFRTLQESENSRRLWRRLVIGGVSALGAALLIYFLLMRRWSPKVPERAVSTAPLRAGELIQGNYRIDRELGADRLGTAYEATDLALNRKVALKRLSEACSRDQRLLDSFMEAAGRAAAQRRPGAAQTYAFFEEGGRFYLIEEFTAAQTGSQGRG